MPGVYGDDGRWVEGETTVFTIRCTVQPLNQTEIQNLSEGERSTGRTLKIYTKALLNTPAQGIDGVLPQTADRVMVDGVEYEVFGKANYNSGIISHNRYYAKEMPEPDDT